MPFTPARIVSLMLLIVSGNHVASASDAVAPEASELAGLISDYRHLHQHPELSFEEVATSRYMADRLEAIGYQVTRSVGGHGVVAMLDNGDGPVVMVRSDLDGLPIREQTGLSFASTQVAQQDDGSEAGVMHACGHDIHMTVMLGTAERLMRLKAQWSGTLMLIAQPAEERSGGAKAMLADGLFERFARPDVNLAIHVSSDIPAGQVAAVAGFAMANVDSVDIVVRGIGGHGAYPDRNKDPIVLAAQLINALQTIVSREVSPLEPAVVTVGSIHGGSQHNIIPGEVTLQLTLRSYSPEVRDQIIAAIRRISRNLGLAAGLDETLLPVVTVLDEHTPAAFNDPQLTQRITAVFAKVLGEQAIAQARQEMVGEDFGRYGAVSPKIPSLMFRLGTVSADDFQRHLAGDYRLPPLHSAQFAPDAEPTIRTGVTAMTAAVLDLMSGSD